MNRREFIPGIAATAIGTGLGLHALGRETPGPVPPDTDDEPFWEGIRAQFRTGGTINLNNAGVNPHPLPVEEAFFNYHRICNDTPSLAMWRTLDRELRKEMHTKLAGLAGCPAENIAVNRNATEALVTVIMGLPLKKGDEVVLSHFDYPRMLNAWKWREKRDGIKLRWVDPEIGSPDQAAVTERYVSQFNGKTRVLHLTHMINWSGRLVPAKDIIAEARKRGIVTIVDAAHSFAHIPFSVTDLGCDYLGVSLHKWLCAPFGSGMLYAGPGNIERLTPLFPIEDDLRDNIKKFEELGTRNNASEYAISQAVDFHLSIGPQRKYDRLVELRNHWVYAVNGHPRIRIRTPLGAGMSGGIALVEILDKDHEEILHFLQNRYQIHTVLIQRMHLTGLRIAPNIYTKKEELDLLAEALLYQADRP